MARKKKQLKIDGVIHYIQGETDDFYFVSATKSGEKKFPVKKSDVE